MTGTTIAQAIPIAISPILTRIYTPEDFGIFALYMSIVSIVSVIATGRYEMAIMLPKKEEDAINIVVLSSIISIFISFISFIIIFLFNNEITNILATPEISIWLYFIPIAVLSTGIYQSLNYYINRKKEYKLLAINRVTQSGLTSLSTLALGFGGLGSAGLIFGGIVGKVGATSILARLVLKNDSKILHKVKVIKMYILAKRYIKFPKYDILASASNISAQQVTHILFNILFSSTTAGYYYLTQRIIGLPITFIASAISDVFREQASTDYNKYKNAKNIYTRTFFKLMLLSFFPSIFIYIFAIDIFTIIFGKEWSIAGEYAQILTPMLFLRFISSPLSFMLYIGEKQQLNLFGNLLFLFLTLLCFYLADTAIDTVYLLSCSYSFIYILYIYFSAKIAKVF
ncbi:MAG: oligosaccharide flippase family protein [Gammaproteobacteria bacterium]|nr:oligosaccharide flippase family protein [Gammaproteobacteria bacterium]